MNSWGVYVALFLFLCAMSYGYFNIKLFQLLRILFATGIYYIILALNTCWRLFVDLLLASIPISFTQSLAGVFVHSFAKLCCLCAVAILNACIFRIVSRNCFATGQRHIEYRKYDGNLMALKLFLPLLMKFEYTLIRLEVSFFTLFLDKQSIFVLRIILGYCCFSSSTYSKVAIRHKSTSFLTKMCILFSLTLLASPCFIFSVLIN